MGKFVEVIAGLLAIGAGIYLLQSQSVSVAGVDGTSWFQVLAHGIGVYFIARGLWMLGHVGRQDAVTDRLDRLIELGALEHQARHPDETPPAKRSSGGILTAEEQARILGQPISEGSP